MFLDGANGEPIGEFYQQDQTGGEISHSAIAVNSATDQVFVMANFPSTPMITFSQLGWDGSAWRSLIQRTWPPSKITNLAQYNENSVFLALNEDYVFTLSTTDGGNKDEDCTLSFWDVASLSIPVDGGNKSKKNHNGQARNCKHPKMKTDGSYLYVLVTIEYMPISTYTYTGFMTYKVDSAYTNF